MSLTALEIEKLSFEIIEKEFDFKKFSPLEKEVVKRVVHATADPEYIETMVFHKDAISLALNALKNEMDILVDVKMLEAGISKRLLGKSRVICYLSEVKEGKGTRTERAIELAFKREKNIGIIAIGNAPTALFKVIELLKEVPEKQIVVIGMPVGFVNAFEAKELLTRQQIPFITNLSRKGGTPATCAVINALLKIKNRMT